MHAGAMVSREVLGIRFPFPEKDVAEIWTELITAQTASILTKSFTVLSVCFTGNVMAPATSEFPDRGSLPLGEVLKRQWFMP